MKIVKEDEGVDPAVGEKELDAVKDILRTLTKTQKTFTVYPKDNPIYQKFAAELFDKLNMFFDSGEERTDNMALLLFADGYEPSLVRAFYSIFT